MISRCCWFIQPATATRTNCSGCDREGMASRLPEAGLIGGLGRARGNLGLYQKPVVGVDRIVGQYVMDRIDFKEAVSVYMQLIEAWNRRSADEFAALFAEDGNSVGFDGSPLDGQAEIASELRRIFASHATAAYVAKVREVRRLSPEVTLLRAAVGMVPPGKTELNPAVNAIQSVVLVERGGRSKVSLLHNTPAAFHGRPQLAEQLTRELEAVLHSGRIVWTDES
jgi:uncharacterized protein (TIGR02246 family)